MTAHTTQAQIKLERFYLLESPSGLKKTLFFGELQDQPQGAVGRFVDFHKKSAKWLGDPQKFEFSEGLSAESYVWPSFEGSSFESYQRQFKQVQVAFFSKELSKAVLYRLNRGEGVFPSKEVFLKLVCQARQRQRQGHLYAFYDGVKKEAFAGISPEYLFLKNQKGECVTVAVAGTQKAGEGAWDEKLYDEHRKVCEGVSQKVQVQWQPVQEKTFGALKHLYCKGVVSENESIGTLSYKLHPTAAVGTLPQGAYKTVELGPEGRGYFGGFVELLLKEEAFSVVTIRGFEWCDGMVQVGIGGGVVPTSQLDQEWQELDLKWEALRKVWL